MFGLGIGEIVIILIIALIFIGPKKLPELAKGLGRGLKEFQNAAKGIQESLNNPTSQSNVELPQQEIGPVAEANAETPPDLKISAEDNSNKTS